MGTNGVVVMPFPRTGHINPLFNLCHLLSCRSGLTTVYTVIVTEEWHRIFGSDPKPDNIQLMTIPYVYSSELEPGDDGDSTDYVFSVQSEMEKQFDRVLDTLPLPVKFIIADVTLGEKTFDLANRRNIPVAAYWPMSASTLTFLHYKLTRGGFGNRHLAYRYYRLGHEDAYDDYIPGLSLTRVSDLPRMVCMPKIGPLFPLKNRAKCLLLATIYELESDAVDKIVEKTSIPVYVIGLNISHFRIQPSLSSSESSCHLWLESKAPNSVLYISLGSLVCVSGNQIAEILAGLKQSGVAFLWAAGGEASRLSGEYGSDGLVVEWCDQLRILLHSSVGGFMTHCGWNSTKESLFSGVPLLNFPVRGSDQALNSKLIYEDWKTGRKLKSYNALVSREVVEEVVREFMGLEGYSRTPLVENVKGIEGVCRKSVEEGGQVDKEIDCFIRDSETNWLLPNRNRGLIGTSAF